MQREVGDGPRPSTLSHDLFLGLRQPLHRDANERKADRDDKQIGYSTRDVESFVCYVCVLDEYKGASKGHKVTKEHGFRKLARWATMQCETVCLL